MSKFTKIRVDLFNLALNGGDASIGAVKSTSTTNKQNNQINGSTEIIQFQRLISDLPPQPDTVVNWSISAYCNSIDQYFISVLAQATVTVVCQRCMGSMELNIDSDNQFIIFKTEDEVHAYDEAAVDEDLEPLLVDTMNFDVLELIEDELILNMPFTPKHDDCVADEPDNAGITLNGGLADRPSPFAILSKLKKN